MGESAAQWALSDEVAHDGVRWLTRNLRPICLVPVKYAEFILAAVIAEQHRRETDA